MASFLDWYCNSRLGFRSDILTFSLNPEIVSLFGKSTPLPIADIQQTVSYHGAKPAQLFQICLSSETEEATFLSALQCTVVTTGILAVVGVCSFYTFRLLQCIRQGRCLCTLQNVKQMVVEASKPFVLHWRKSEKRCEPSSQEITPIRHSNRIQSSKRPSDLRLSSWSPRGNRFQTSRENSLERRLLIKDKTPLADCDIASGEEDINDIQGQYFGPTVKSSKICMELLGSSPEDSPIHTLSPTKGLRGSPKKRLDRESY